jgi:hypothetical protein
LNCCLNAEERLELIKVRCIIMRNMHSENDGRALKREQWIWVQFQACLNMFEYVSMWIAEESSAKGWDCKSV